MISQHPLLLALLLCISTHSMADESWQMKHKQITGVYAIYGGSLCDPIAPTAKDRKIMFSVKGKTAREMFDAIGPDVKDACTEGAGIRIRKKDDENLSCIKSERGEYSCNFGFDLRTGKSIGCLLYTSPSPRD